MKSLQVILCLGLATCLCVGCGKKNQRPADLPPDMTPCVITVIQDGKPLEGANVAFEYDTPVKYTTSGSTNEKGEATMMTYGFAGAQQGSATILVRKIAAEGGKQAEEYGDVEETGTDFELVDQKYRSVETSDLKITIGKENVAQKVDVGAAIHEPSQKK